MATGNPRLERWSNDGESTLNGAISDSVTSITINSAASFPTSPDFHITIGDEILLVTAVSGSTFTVERGADDTTAAAHDDNDVVALLLTAGSVDQAVKDGFSEFDYPMNRILEQGTTRVHSDFTWLNQGSATSADADDGGILITCPSEAADQVRGKYVSAPSTPWTLTTFCMLGPGMKDYTGTAGDGSYMGPMLRESSSGKLYMFVLRGDRIALWRMSNVTTFSAEVDSYINNNRHSMWLQIEDDGTDIKAHVSVDGYVWDECFNEGRTSFMSGGPDQVGFGVSSGNGTSGAHFYVKSWILE